MSDNYYTAPSLHGYKSLTSYYPVLPEHKKLSKLPDYFRVSNNKYPDCPAIMDDGRAFTDYRSSCFMNNMLKVKNNIRNSYEYRQFLIRNGEQVMNDIRLYNIKKSSCRPCDAKPIPCD